MKFDSIAEIFSSNDDAHYELKRVLADVAEDRVNNALMARRGMSPKSSNTSRSSTKAHQRSAQSFLAKQKLLQRRP